MPIIVPLCLTLIFSTVAASAKPAKQPTLADFCADPVKVICGPHLLKKQTRDKRVDSLQEQIKEVAWNSVVAAIPDAVWEEVPFGKENAPDLTNRQAEIAKLYFTSINIELKKTIGKAYEHYKPAFTRVLDFMIRTFQSRLKEVRPNDVSEMLKILDAKKLQFIDALEVLEPNSSIDKEILEAVVEMCGRDGLEDNAFANGTENFNYLVICPGDYLGSFDPNTKSGISAVEIAGELWTMGHELGHHIDSSVFPEAYSKLSQCVADNTLEDLGELGDDGERKRISRREVSKYMREISSDYWGTEALADLLLSVKLPQTKLYILQDSLEGLCNSEDDGESGGHPDGRYRIENFVRRNPRLHEAAGCSIANSRETAPTCTLRGEWRMRFW